MRSALRRIRWGLLAAGALGLSGPALAQRPAGVDYAGPSRPAAAAPAPSDPRARAEAIQVALAWLSDPITFPYPLTACPSGDGLEVSGEVPGPAVRQLALQMARAHATLPVTDRLTINPGLESHGGGGDAAVLRDRASALLAAAFPSQAPQITVQAQADGRLTVTGAVATPDERLAVSRVMRRLAGCTCVANELEVRPAVDAGRHEARGPAAPGVTQAVLHAAEPRPAVTPALAQEHLNDAPPVIQTAAHEPTDLPPELLPKEKAASGGDGYVTSGVLIRHTQGPAAKPAERARPVRPGAAAGVPVVPAGQTAAAGPAPALDVRRLKRRIESVAGRAAHDIEVVPQPGNGVEIRFRVASVGEGEKLSAKFVGLPELEPYQISFKMQLDH
jgi:hypothetical protein